jgi:hypothetical protein
MRAGQPPILPAAIRARIAADAAAGMTLQAIADALDTEAVPTARGERVVLVDGARRNGSSRQTLTAEWTYAATYRDHWYRPG